jgi:predicted phage baseplate assembly protein
MLRYPVDQAQPWISLHSASVWLPRRDLLNSDRFAQDFVVETKNDGTASLRFGDGILGRRPAAGQTFQATYRVGNGPAGNVGATAIARLVTPLAGLKRVWNPLPAVGGLAPESPDQVRQFAPQAFRTQERAVTEADYAEVTQRRPDVQRAVANLRWTGSWYTAFVAVDRRGGLPVEANFEQEMQTYLNRYRLAGYDLEIAGPHFVPLDLALFVCARSGYFRSQVKQRLLEIFSSQNLATGERGFFHPDNFTFGQPLYLSRIYEVALSVAGVETVDVTRFQRWGRVAKQELEQGVLLPGLTEVIRLDNDPNFPENGKLEIVVQGGL